MLTLFSVVLVAALIAHEFTAGGSAAAWLETWGLVPLWFWEAVSTDPVDWTDPALTGIVTALFVHVEWLHLAGNLAYFWVFGIMVERALGPWRFALCFLLLGGLANACLAWQMAGSDTPVIGASGGVSAIVGLYLGLFPGRRMGLWLPLGLYIQFARVPGLVVIGSWFALQMIYTVFGVGVEAVAWAAHLAGFVGGLTIALLLRVFSVNIDTAFLQD